MDKTELGLQLGKIAYWDMDCLDPRRPPQDQLEHLKEDLAQVELSPNAVLDIGWYGQEDGTFRILVIREMNWEDPIFQARSTSWRGLAGAVSAAIAVWQTTDRDPPQSV
jgi:hypothetical protein